MIMDTVFNKEHGLTKEEKKAILGFDNVSLKHFKGFNQRSHYNVLYRLYQYRGDEKMANKYKDLIPNDERKVFGTCLHDFATSRDSQ